MADINKKIEIEIGGNIEPLEKAVSNANDVTSKFRREQNQESKKGDTSDNKKATKSKATVALEDRLSKVKGRVQTKELKLLRDSNKAQKTKTAELEKQVVLLKKQLGIVKQINKKGGADAGMGGGGGGGFFKGFGGMLKRFAVAVPLLAAGAAVGAVSSQVRAGYQTYVEAEQAQAGLQSLTRDRAGYDAAVGPGYAMGFTRSETARQAIDIARKTGDVGAVTLAQQVTRAGVGLDFGGASNVMGQLAQAGQGFGKKDPRGKKELENIIARGFESGLDRSRMGEFISGVGSLIQRQGGVAVGDVSGASAAKLLALLGGTDQTGFQGTRGAAVLSKLDQSVRRPGGGEEGKAFLMRAFGFGTPGGTAGFMEARARQQQGIAGPKGVENFLDIFKQAKREFGRGDASTFVLEELTGLSQVQVEGLKDIASKLEEATGGDRTRLEEEIAEALKSAKSIEEQMLAANMTDFATVVTELAKITKHLDELGKEVFDPIHEIQKNINKVIADNIPAIKKFLETIAGATTDIRKYFLGPAEAEITESKSMDTFQELQKVKAQHRQNKLSDQEYEDKLKELAKKNRQLYLGVSSGTGAGSAFTAAADYLGVAAMKAAGITGVETAAVAKERVQAGLKVNMKSIRQEQERMKDKALNQPASALGAPQSMTLNIEPIVTAIEESSKQSSVNTKTFVGTMFDLTTKIPAQVPVSKGVGVNSPGDTL